MKIRQLQSASARSAPPPETEVIRKAITGAIQDLKDPSTSPIVKMLSRKYLLSRGIQVGIKEEGHAR